MVNFSSGPSYICEEIKQEAIKAIQDYNFSNISILELGHRTKEYKDIMLEIENLLRHIMNLGIDWKVMLMQGGATMQFFQIPYNFLLKEKGAIYFNTGTWSTKAIREASYLGKIDTILLADDMYSKEARDIETKVRKEESYAHLTTNETIEGVQLHEIPALDVPVIADMSSDILSREVDFNKFDMIYAAAQKNLGIAGVTLVLVKEKFLKERQSSDIPQNHLNYKRYIETKGIPNTPPVFAVYMLLLSLRNIKNRGIKNIQRRNEEKAKKIYSCIDGHQNVYLSSIKKKYRSNMNIVFRLQNNIMEAEFLALAEKEGFYGIKGHRSRGGFRVANYNHIEEKKHIAPFVSFMNHFAKTKT